MDSVDGLCDGMIPDFKQRADCLIVFWCAIETNPLQARRALFWLSLSVVFLPKGRTFLVDG
eukprot:4109115-Amphidinium_carterae.1